MAARLEASPTASVVLDKDYEQPFNDRHEVQEPHFAEGSVANVYKVVDTDTGEASVIKVQKVANQVYYCAQRKEEYFLHTLRNCVYFPVLHGGYDLEPNIRVSHIEMCPDNLFATYLNPTTRKRLPWLDRLNLTFQSLSAAQVLRDNKVVHKDLTPENMNYAEGTGRLRVIDFGLANTDDEIPHNKFRVGTRYYRAPENALGIACDASMDVWSLGCIFSELVMGVPPFVTLGDEESTELDRAHLLEIMKQRGQLPKKWRKTKEYSHLFSNNKKVPISECPVPLAKQLTKRLAVLHPEVPKGERREYADLTCRMLSYGSERLTAKEGIQHPLFNQYLFLQMEREKNDPGCMIQLSPVKGEKTDSDSASVDLCAQPRVHRMIRRAKDDTYKVVLTPGAGTPTECTVKIPPRSTLQVSGLNVKILPYGIKA